MSRLTACSTMSGYIVRRAITLKHSAVRPFESSHESAHCLAVHHHDHDDMSLDMLQLQLIAKLSIACDCLFLCVSVVFMTGAGQHQHQDSRRRVHQANSGSRTCGSGQSTCTCRVYCIRNLITIFHDTCLVTAIDTAYFLRFTTFAMVVIPCAAGQA